MLGEEGAAKLVAKTAGLVMRVERIVMRRCWSVLCAGPPGKVLQSARERQIEY